MSRTNLVVNHTTLYNSDAIILQLIVGIIILSVIIPSLSLSINTESSQPALLARIQGATDNSSVHDLVFVNAPVPLKSSESPTIQTYEATFLESGLPTDTQWKLALLSSSLLVPVHISSTQHYADLSLHNGSYHFYVNASYHATKLGLTGNFSIIGSVITIPLVFPHPFYNLTIIEYGAPTGANLSVELANANKSVESTINFTNTSVSIPLPDGIYQSKEITNLDQQNLSFNIGYYTFVINGESQNFTLRFPRLYNVSSLINSSKINEPWTVHVDGYTNGSIVGYVGNIHVTISGESSKFPINYNLQLPNGSYRIELSFHYTYWYNPTNMYFNIDGTPSTFNVTFPKIYKVTFIENGLPYGNWWEVVVDNANESNIGVEGTFYSNYTTGTTLSVYLANSSYLYYVESAPFGCNNTNIQVQSNLNNFVVNGSSENVTVFGIMALGLHKLIFVENMLTFTPNTQWSLSLSGNFTIDGYNIAVTYENYSYGISMQALLPDGTFHFIGKYMNFYSSNTSFSFNGTDKEIFVRFPFYAVNFSVQLIPSDTTWGVYISSSNGIRYGTESNNLTEILTCPNGTYSYSAYMGSFYITSRNFTMNGTSQNITIGFPVYSINFSETGLPNGTKWEITFNGTEVFSNSRNVTFAEFNGSYLYNIPNVVGYNVTPNIGSVFVIGGNLNITISFHPQKGQSFLAHIAELVKSVQGVLFIIIAVGVFAIIYIEWEDRKQRSK